MVYQWIRHLLRALIDYTDYRASGVPVFWWAGESPAQSFSPIPGPVLAKYGNHRQDHHSQKEQPEHDVVNHVEEQFDFLHLTVLSPLA